MSGTTYRELGQEPRAISTHDHLETVDDVVFAEARPEGGIQLSVSQLAPHRHFSRSEFEEYALGGKCSDGRMR